MGLKLRKPGPLKTVQELIGELLLLLPVPQGEMAIVQGGESHIKCCDETKNFNVPKDLLSRTSLFRRHGDVCMLCPVNLEGPTSYL